MYIYFSGFAEASSFDLFYTCYAFAFVYHSRIETALSSGLQHYRVSSDARGTSFLDSRANARSRFDWERTASSLVFKSPSTGAETRRVKRRRNLACQNTGRRVPRRR